MAHTQNGLVLFDFVDFLFDEIESIPSGNSNSALVHV